METKTLQFKIDKSIESDDRSIGTIKGWASVFNNVDLVGDTILPGAFTSSIKRFKKSGRMIPMLSGHSMHNLIGGFDPQKIKETEDGLYVEGQVDLETQGGREAFSLMKKGFITGMSIGGYAPPAGIEMRVDGRDISEFMLYEISVTPIPAEPNAQLTDVKSATSFKDYPLMSEDTEWDKAKAIKQIRDKTESEDEPSGTYRNGFMWFDSDDSGSFGSYKLPYTYVVDGQFKAVPRAIFAIASVLQGGRGGVDIPDFDKAKVKAHVERYYKKMDRPSPFKNSDDSDKKGLNIENEYDSLKKVSDLDLRLSVMKLNNAIRRIKK